MKQKANLPLILVIAGLALAFSRPVNNMMSSVKLDLQIQKQPVIMPSAYKVYANENALEGQYSLFKMLITNNSSSTAKNVEVVINMPGYIEKKTVQKFPLILPGQSVVVNCYPSFPEKIVEKTTSSKEEVTIQVKGSNIKELEEHFKIEVKGRNEFMYSSIPAEEIRTWNDMFDNFKLITCFVTPEDPIVKYFTQKIQEKVLKGETASVHKAEKEALRFMMGIYNAMLMSHMVYSGTTGVPATIDNVRSLIQHIRLPREVITGRTGLCIELSLVYASIMMNAGLDPVIYLIPGHAYPGFKMNGRYYAIESTAIGGEGMGGSKSAEEAVQIGTKNLEQFFAKMGAGDETQTIIDIRQYVKNGAVAMELKDDPYLRQKIDEIAASFDGGSYGDMAGTGGSSGGGGYSNFDGVVNFSYPSSWNVKPAPPELMPQLKYVVSNSDISAFVEVYSFPGVSDPSQTMAIIRSYINRYGGDMKYQSAGQSANGFSMFRGNTYLNGQTYNWAATMKPTGGGIAGIVAGINAATGGQHEATVMNILNTLK